MKYCSSCGNKLKEKTKFCGNCGNNLKSDAKEKTEKFIDDFLDTEDDTKSFKKKDIDNNKIIAAVSYLGILVLIPFLGAKESKFAQYHAKQGINLCVVWIIHSVSYRLISLIKFPTNCNYWLVKSFSRCYATPWWIHFVFNIIGIIIAIFAVIGIINVIQGKAKKLPIIGIINIIS